MAPDVFVRWTRWVLGHRRLVVLCWLVLAVAGGGTAGLTTSRLGKTFTLPGRPSYVTDARILSLYHSGGADPVIPVVSVPAGVDLGSRANRARLGALERAASVHGRYRVVGFTGTGDRRFLVAGGRSTFMLVFTPPVGFGSPDPAPSITAATRASLPAGWTVQTTGSGVLQSGTGARAGHGVLYEAVLGGLGALVVLALVFGSPLAILPLVMAVVAIPTTFLCLLGLTALTVMNFVVQFLIALVGLGVAIDYSLLVTTRWREEATRRSGDDAVVAAMATAGRAVAFSGTTVAIGMIALAVLPVPFLHSMGYAGFLIPLVSVAVALSLLPVCLATIGPRLDRYRLRRADSLSPPWRAWAVLVTRHKVLAALAGALVLGAIVAPVADLRVGQPVSGSLTTSGTARAALTTLERGGVPSGVLNPMEVLTQQHYASRVATTLGRVPGVYAALAPSGPADRRGGTAIVTVLPAAETGAAGGQATIGRVEKAASGMRGVLGVGGTGPETVDLDHAIYDGFPLVLALVSLLTFVVLVRAFRSLLLAAKAVVLNLASLAAAYGVLVYVWQQGHGSRAVFGLPAAGAIPSWIPIVVFAFLFGLAIDYEVFILARMREAYDASGDTSAAVVEGLSRTGRLVTSAALILTLAFLSMSTAPLSFLKILATGLAAGILVDAFVVRSLLVPALVALFGRWNWALPTPVARVLWLRDVPAAPEPSAAD
jgi:RND superfamily putative drug exporter